MKNKATVAARILLGIVFFGSGVFGLVTRFKFPPNLPPNLLTFVQGLTASVYFLPLLKITELVCGLLLLVGWFVPLALVVLAPIIINIFFTHLFLEPSGIPMAVIIGSLEIYLAFFSPLYSPPIRALFRSKVKRHEEDEKQGTTPHTDYSAAAKIGRDTGGEVFDD